MVLETVLILVLVEVALREDNLFFVRWISYDVLILVLVEAALRGDIPAATQRRGCVLILVLVEAALRDINVNNINTNRIGLNPCFSGSCSARVNAIEFMINESRVLILVLVEAALRGNNRVMNLSRNSKS